MQGVRYKSRSSSSPHWGDVVRGSDSGEGTSGTSIPSFLPPTLPLTELRISPPAQTSGSGRWSEVEGIHKRVAELRGWAELGNVAAPLVEAKRPSPMASSSGQEGRSDFAVLFFQILSPIMEAFVQIASKGRVHIWAKSIIFHQLVSAKGQEINSAQYEFP